MTFPMFQIFPATDFGHCITLGNVRIQIRPASDILGVAARASKILVALGPTSQQDMLIVILLKRTPSLILKVAFFAALAWVSTQSHNSGDHCFGQSSAPAAEKELTVQQKVQRHRELLQAMRDKLRLITEAEMRFYLDGAEESYNWSDKWDTNVAALQPIREEFESLAVDLFINHENAEGVPDSLPETVFSVRKQLLETDRDADTIAVLKRLHKLKPEIDQLKLDLGLALLKTNQFAQANEIIDKIPPNKLEDLEGVDNKLLMIRKPLEAAYEQEAKTITAESEDDLPRVELMTTKGPIIVELFENEAPDTVGNFIHLVESGFYTDVIFHRVIARFMAQTGLVTFSSNGYSMKQPGYSIYDETKGGRSHFSGYLSMAKTDQPNSGGGQFFITYEPTVFLDGRHTVFGRVIQGMENAGRLLPTHEMKEEKDKPPEEVAIESITPDRILSAKVIRKRDHEYKPNKVLLE